MPLLLGLTSVAGALGALGLVSQIAPKGSSTAPVVVLIGLAVGVDYSLFYIRREREERAPAATADARSDRGDGHRRPRHRRGRRSPSWSGWPDCCSPASGVFTSMALGAILVVAIAVVGSVTVLPGGAGAAR